MDTQFGTRIRDLRKQRGMTLRELAERAGIDFTYLSKVENSKIPPPSEQAIIRIAEALHADADELLSLASKIDKSLQEFVIAEPDAPRLLRAWKAGRLEEARQIIDRKGKPGEGPNA